MVSNLELLLIKKLEIGITGQIMEYTKYSVIKNLIGRLIEKVLFIRSN